MTGYVRTDEGMKIWAPRRALTKQTYPGMMDNTVAGGLSTGEKPFECLVRECEEEASLPAGVVQPVRACGTLTYFHVRDSRAGGETGLYHRTSYQNLEMMKRSTSSFCRWKRSRKQWPLGNSSRIALTCWWIFL